MNDYYKRVKESLAKSNKIFIDPINDTLPDLASEWETVIDWMKDLGDIIGKCDLCGHLHIRYQFKIFNILNKTEIITGSKCIIRFKIKNYEKIEEMEKRIKNRLSKENRIVYISELLPILDIPLEFVNEFIDYYKKYGSFDINQMKIIITQLKYFEDGYDPRIFKIRSKTITDKTFYPDNLKDLGEFLTTKQKEKVNKILQERNYYKNQLTLKEVMTIS